MELLKYIKCIKPSEEERIQSVLPKLGGSAYLMLSSAIEAGNSRSLIASYMKFLPMVLSKKIVAPSLNTVCRTYQMFADKFI